MPVHLPQEQENGGGQDDECVAQHPEKVREDAGKIPGNDRALKLDGVDKGQCVGDLLKYAAD